jgi:hypothetical protein
MKVSNFCNVKRIPGPGPHIRTLISQQMRYLDRYRNSVGYSVVADVDVTTETRKLWWIITTVETHSVFLEQGDSHWRWLDTGRWTPHLQVENLYRAYCIREAINKI